MPKKLSLCKEDTFREDLHAVSATVRNAKKKMANALPYVKDIVYPNKNRLLLLQLQYAVPKEVMRTCLHNI